MKTKNIILIAFLVLLAGLVSCKKDHDVPTGKVFNAESGGGNSGGGEEPGVNDTIFEYVDLGLPSGTLWATCNVGADSPEKYGDYFAWAETQPKTIYNWSTYQYCMGNYNTFTKYCQDANYGYNDYTDNLTTLLPEDDAATANWGSNWRIPTKAEWQELYNNTTRTWTTQNGVYGRRFTASNGNSLFLPAAGSYSNMGLYYTGSRGYYWSSSLCSNPSEAWIRDFYSDEGSLYSWERRCYGLSIRAVRSSSQNYTISVSANPSNGGKVTGGGTFNYGESCTVQAEPAEGFVFANWMDDGDEVSEEASYIFTVTSNRTLVANFTELQANEYSITVSANPSEGGTVTGGGTYEQGEQCRVTAAENADYTFTNWTEDGTVVSEDANYTFIVNRDRTLVANFTAQLQAPEGAVNGMFTIDGNGNKVYFSQGNLQYNAAQGTHLCADGTTKPGTWQFAAHQYDIIGNANSGIGEYYNDWIDLFGWGTSGYNNPSDPYNMNYCPWSTSWETVNEIYNYYGYGPSTNMPSPNLKDSSEYYDWGVFNVIYGAGNQPNQWRTLTREEWVYVFRERTTSSGIRYAKAQIIGLSGGESIIGMILLPDDWSTNYYTLNNTDQFQANFTSNLIEVDTWENSLESHGAVFLPAAGYRFENSISYVNHYGEYWSATYSDSSSAYYVHIGHSDFTPQSSNYKRYSGFSVRLVHSAQ